MKNIVFAVLFVLCLGGSQNAMAQISYIEDMDIASLEQKYINQNKSTGYTLGYRVQILSTADRRKMETIKQEFMNKFPDLIPVDTYEAPNYKLRVGAFKTKLETEQVKHRLRAEYPSVFPVKDNKIRPVEYL